MKRIFIIIALLPLFIIPIHVNASTISIDVKATNISNLLYKTVDENGELIEDEITFELTSLTSKETYKKKSYKSKIVFYKIPIGQYILKSLDDTYKGELKINVDEEYMETHHIYKNLTLNEDTIDSSNITPNLNVNTTKSTESPKIEYIKDTDINEEIPHTTENNKTITEKISYNLDKVKEWMNSKLFKSDNSNSNHNLLSYSLYENGKQEEIEYARNTLLDIMLSCIGFMLICFILLILFMLFLYKKKNDNDSENNNISNNNNYNNKYCIVIVVVLIVLLSMIGLTKVYGKKRNNTDIINITVSNNVVITYDDEGKGSCTPLTIQNNTEVLPIHLKGLNFSSSKGYSLIPWNKEYSSSKDLSIKLGDKDLTSNNSFDNSYLKIETGNKDELDFNVRDKVFKSKIDTSNVLDVDLEFELGQVDVTLSFNTDSGSSIQPITQKNWTTTKLPATSKIGYTFLYWEDPSGTKYNSGDTYRFPLKDTTLKAIYKINNYTLSFNTNGGSTISNITKEYNSNITIPNTTKTGYTLSHFTDTKGNTYKVGNSYTIKDYNETFTAHWNINRYTINFNSNGGTGVHSITNNYNSTVNLPSAPSRTGYTFAGWKHSNGTVYNAGQSYTVPAGNQTFTAQWNIIYYTVTFNTNGGNSINNQTIAYGGTLTLPSLSYPGGGREVSYWLDSSGTKYSNNQSIVIKSNMSFTAYWQKNYAELISGPEFNNIIKPYYNKREETNINIVNSPTEVDGSIYGSGQILADYIISSSESKYKINCRVFSKHTAQWIEIWTEPSGLDIYYNEDSSYMFSHIISTRIDYFINKVKTNYIRKTDFMFWLCYKGYIEFTISSDINSYTSMFYRTSIANDSKVYINYTPEYYYKAKQIYDYSITYYDSGNIYLGSQVNNYSLLMPNYLSRKYFLTLDLQEGELLEDTPSNYYLEQEELFILPTPKRNGYRFDGWYSDNLYSNLPITQLENITEDKITLYAKWIPIQQEDSTNKLNIIGDELNKLINELNAYVEYIYFYKPEEEILIEENKGEIINNIQYYNDLQNNTIYIYTDNSDKIIANDDMSNSFYSLSSLKKIDLSNLDMSNTIYINNLFKDCIFLEEIITDNNFNSGNIISMPYAFYNCSNLNCVLDISMENTIIYDDIFYNCSTEELSKLNVTINREDILEELNNNLSETSNIELNLNIKDKL